MSDALRRPGRPNPRRRHRPDADSEAGAHARGVRMAGGGLLRTAVDTAVLEPPRRDVGLNVHGETVTTRHGPAGAILPVSYAAATSAPTTVNVVVAMPTPAPAAAAASVPEAGPAPTFRYPLTAAFSAAFATYLIGLLTGIAAACWFLPG